MASFIMKMKTRKQGQCVFLSVFVSVSFSFALSLRLSHSLAYCLTGTLTVTAVGDGLQGLFCEDVHLCCAARNKSEKRVKK